MQLDRMYSILLAYERGEEVTKTESSLMKPVFNVVLMVQYEGI
jgi:hypothetical protein